MSYLLRWVRYNQSLATRSMTLMTNGNSVYERTAASQNNNLKPLYQVVRSQPIMTPTPSLLSQLPPRPPHPPPPRPGIDNNNNNKMNEETSEKKDDINYVIQFKRGLDVKKVFKEFYSLYGPLFVVCHIGIGLISLGFFCSLTWFAIDLTQMVPDFVVARIGESMASMTGTGGKFVVAYAIHKLILPVRLGAAIYVTRLLSRVIKKKRKMT
uniref:Protein FAM210B n=1 Tax=Aceria tosichella TaxID=561515 RepID=A0A6G1SNG8_9ACAR